ncbi:MAG: hypothetical protein JWM20_983 [Patescibacteria group bacterium]|nr:hypothetical protein [Patescibacteria group bacterium]
MLDIKNEFTELISGSEEIIIDECRGSDILENTEGLFHINEESFRKFKLKLADEISPNIPTDKISAEVYQRKKDATLLQMFGSFGTDISTLCMSWKQIKIFCKKHPMWLCGGGFGTLFITKINGEYAVASLNLVPSIGLRMSAFPLEEKYVFSWGFQHLVVPRLSS